MIEVLVGISFSQLARSGQVASALWFESDGGRNRGLTVVAYRYRESTGANAAGIVWGGGGDCSDGMMYFQKMESKIADVV